MKTNIKTFSLTILSLLVVITPVLAQEGEEAVSAASFVGSYSLWAAVIIGLVASATTVYFATRMRGGIVGTSLTYIGAGMFFVVLGFLAVVIPWGDDSSIKTIIPIVHDFAFIAGYILMLVGALRMRAIAS